MTYYVQRASFSLKGITFASLKFVCLVVSVVFGGVISQQAAEIGYHIFYQLLSGRKPELIGETDKAAISPVNREL